MTCKSVLSAVFFCFLASIAQAQETPRIPDIAQAMLDSAYGTGDPAEVAAVARAVKAVFPDYEQTITAQTEIRLAEMAPKEPVASTTADKPSDDPGGYFAVKPWDGSIKAGASYASGNSDNLAAGVKIDAARTAGPWVHNFTGYLDYAESNGVTNQQRWGASYQLDYNFGERTYLYGRFSYDKDDFSGFDYRLFGGAGLGHFFYKSEAFTWKMEGGPGYRYSPIELSDMVEREFAIYGSSEVDWLIREGLTFEQDFNLTWTAPSTTLQSITSLTTVLTDDISMGLSFEFRYETNPPFGRFNADEIARASLVYGF